MSDRSTVDLAPNPSTVQHFLTRLDEDAERWTFQTFDDDRDRQDPTLTRVLHGALDEHLATLAELNRRGAGVFATINETDLCGRKKSNITRVRAVWQEDDGEGEPLPLEPHLVVESSPGKFHRYLFVDGLDLDEHGPVQEALVELFGSDPNAKDLSRVLRLPGFYHRKGAPHLVRIVEESHQQPHSREALLEAVPPVERKAAPQVGADGREIPEGNRNGHLTSLAGTMRRRGMSEDSIAAALHAENQLRCHPPLDQAEVQGIAHSIARYEPAEDPSAAVAQVEGAIKALADGDSGAPFAPDVLKCLASIKTQDRAAFEALRDRLKEEGCRVTSLDEAVAEAGGGPGGRGPTQADVLIGLADESDLFHTSEGIGYADLDVNGHRETWPIRSKEFRRWLARRFFEVTAGAPNSEALQSALNVIEAQAHFDGAEADVHIRVAGHEGMLYLDLGDPEWRAVEIDAGGWRLIDCPPVRFRRAAGMQALPRPLPAGSVSELRDFLNVASDRDFVLVAAWALAVLRDKGPYPVIVLSGEQGSAKSTFSAILRSLLDPNSAPLRALPREDRDLFIAANNGHVLAFDNVSGLRPWISDTLCRLATGGGFAVRQLYTDQDEVLFDATRPVVLNGIEDIVTRPDLADRALFLTLEPIPEDKRKPEKALWAAFEEARPRILGALLDAVVHGLRKLPDTRLDKLPRMADFALWATACESAIWPAGTFQAAYDGNRDDAVDSVIEADPVAAAIRSLMEKRTVWTGTSTNLVDVLEEEVGDKATRAKTWPASPRALSGRLRRAATFLRKTGIDIKTGERDTTRKRNKIIRINRRPDSWGAESSRQSAPSASTANSLNGRRIDDEGVRTVAANADAKSDCADANTVQSSQVAVQTDALKINELDSADDADASSRTQTGGWSTTL